jgi:hypothetical protein
MVASSPRRLADSQQEELMTAALSNARQTNRRTRPALSVGLAISAHEILAAQKLRYRVFAEELGARLQSRTPGVDHDIFDPYCTSRMLWICPFRGALLASIWPVSAIAARIYLRLFRGVGNESTISRLRISIRSSESIKSVRYSISDAVTPIFENTSFHCDTRSAT